MSYNRVILMGRITHDLELRTTQSGINMCNFQIAVDRRYQAKGEERKTDFFRVITWRQQAEFVTRYFRKGSMILVEGELQNDNYTDKNGNTVYSVQISAEQISFTGEKANNPQGGTGSYGNAGGYQNGYQSGNAGGYQGGNAGGYQGNPGGYQGSSGGYQGGNAGYSQGGYQSTPQANPMPQQDGVNNANNANNGGDGVPGDFKNAKGDTYPF